jgi:cytochrome c biogenesis protein CcdA
MKKFPVKIYFIVLLASAFIPYGVIALIVWDINIASWNPWLRVGFILWTLIIANNVVTRFKNNE